IAAIRATQLGMSAACVEMDRLGGVCLNIGCIPTKAVLSSALFVTELGSAEHHGVTMEGFQVAMGPAQERSRRVADQMSRGVTHLFKKNKVVSIEGRGRLAGKGEVEVESKEGEKTRYRAKHIIVATGSRPRDLPMIPIDED